MHEWFGTLQSDIGLNGLGNVTSSFQRVERAGTVFVALSPMRIQATFRVACWQNPSRSRLTMSACVAVRPCGRPG
jgi:hypothetical protein